MPDEGSVFVDGIDTEVEDQDNSQDSENGENQDQNSDQTKNTDKGITQDQDDKGDDAHLKNGEKELTEKGTVKDPNPQSAVHQELANIKRERENMRRVLTDPEAFFKYAETAGFKRNEEVKKDDTPKIDPTKIQTAEDLAEVLNSMRDSFTGEISKYKETITGLEKQLQGMSENSRVEKIASSMTSDVSKVREKYPELDPKSPDYNSELEKDIAEMYHELDFDEKTGGYRGNYSIAKLAEKIMSAASKARKQGSEEAQTIVKDKRTGKVVTSSKSTAGGENESSDPGSLIASRINKVFK